MTPDEVRHVRFNRPRIGRRGYDELAVDVLLDRLAATLAGDPQLTYDELANVHFGKPPIGKRGYAPAEVDAFLTRAANEWSLWQR